LDIDDNDMGLGGSETMECKCGMPLCICVAPPKSTDKPNPPVKTSFPQVCVPDKIRFSLLNIAFGTGYHCSCGSSSVEVRGFSKK
jgi:hypothetical protein